MLERAVRNLPWVAVLRVDGLNVYDVLRHREPADSRAVRCDAIQARLAAEAGEGDA